MAERKSRKGKEVEETPVEETPVENTATPSEELLAVVEELNEKFGLEPPIPTEGSYEQVFAALTQSAKETVAEDQKVLTPETWSFLQNNNLIDHLPKPKAKAEKPTKATKPAGEKKGGGGGFKKSPHAEERNKMIEELISAGKYTAVQIVEKVMEKYPEEKKSSVQTIISDAKNPKYTKFGKTAKVNDDKIMSFWSISAGA